MLWSGGGTWGYHACPEDLNLAGVIDLLGHGHGDKKWSGDVARDDPLIQLFDVYLDGKLDMRIQLISCFGPEQSLCIPFLDLLHDPEDPLCIVLVVRVKQNQDLLWSETALGAPLNHSGSLRSLLEDVEQLAGCHGFDRFQHVLVPARVVAPLILQRRLVFMQVEGDAIDDVRLTQNKGFEHGVISIPPRFGRRLQLHDLNILVFLQLLDFTSYRTTLPIQTHDRLVLQDDGGEVRFLHVLSSIDEVLNPKA